MGSDAITYEWTLSGEFSLLASGATALEVAAVMSAPGRRDRHLGDSLALFSAEINPDRVIFIACNPASGDADHYLIIGVGVLRGPALDTWRNEQ